jgi:FkbM family methyltransferase
MTVNNLRTRLGLAWNNTVYKSLGAMIKQCLYTYASRAKTVNIIQVGANDGLEGDYMNQLVALPKSKSILIEPSPYTFSMLQETYKDKPNISLVNKAIVDVETIASRIFYFLEPKKGIPFDNQYTLWSSFNLDHLKKFRGAVQNFDDLLAEKEVPCCTINRLFQESNFGNLDILATDTEGFDFHIINSINFDLFIPKLILFEHYHIAKPQLGELLSKLEQKGYQCYSQGYDTLCVHPSAGKPDWLLKFIKKLRPTWLRPPK